MDSKTLYYNSSTKVVFGSADDQSGDSNVRKIDASEVDGLKADGATVDSSADDLLTPAPTSTPTDSTANSTTAPAVTPNPFATPVPDQSAPTSDQAAPASPVTDPAVVDPAVGSSAPTATNLVQEPVNTVSGTDASASVPQEVAATNAGMIEQQPASNVVTDPASGDQIASNGPIATAAPAAPVQMTTAADSSIVSGTAPDTAPAGTVVNADPQQPATIQDSEGVAIPNPNLNVTENQDVPSHLNPNATRTPAPITYDEATAHLAVMQEAADAGAATQETDPTTGNMVQKPKEPDTHESLWAELVGEIEGIEAMAKAEIVAMLRGFKARVHKL